MPGEKVVAEIGGIFNRMTKTYCAISKLEFLLEAVRLTYENVSSVQKQDTLNCGHFTTPSDQDMLHF